MAPVHLGSAGYRLCAHVKELRSRLGMTQQAFAQIMNVSRSHVSDVEIMRAEPSAKLLTAMLTYDLAAPGHIPAVNPSYLFLGNALGDELFMPRPAKLVQTIGAMSVRERADLMTRLRGMQLSEGFDES